MIAIISSNLGVVNLKEKKYDNALFYFKRSLKIFKY
jgi:Tfp pilus assembly protein PilF